MSSSRSRPSDSLPFLVVDTARALLEDHSVEVGADGQVKVNKALRRQKPSDAARSSLVARLDRLAPAQAATLKLASVSGVRFSAREVLALRPQVDAKTVDGELSSLVAAQCLVRIYNC
eukprot:tig00000042_g15619.t1